MVRLGRDGSKSIATIAVFKLVVKVTSFKRRQLQEKTASNSNQQRRT